MDPDAALKELKELIKAKEEFAFGHGEFWQHDDDRLFDLTVGLVDWLDKGGFLPKAWQR